MIAKLTNGRLVPCPRQGRDGRGGLHTNLPLYYERHADAAERDGFYPVVYTDKPEGDYRSSWALQEVEGVMQIVQTWTEYTPEPEPPVPDIYKMQADIDYLLMMGDYDGGDL